ncbi:MAG: precorrin-6y C5,15-methyltransferase (decarboxylating) subunit CbiE [Alphaproteobacteria bacterium]
MSAWITVIGIGEDGLEGLSPAHRTLVETAEVLVGGDRHLAKVPDGGCERLGYDDGFAAMLDELETRRGRRVVVLASGDPMNYGVGGMLSRRFGVDDMVIHPAPGAFSLAAARMGWSLPDCETLTIHGRPLEMLNLHVSPGARLLVLCRDGDSPAEAAALLTENGYGDSRVTALEHLGGDDENRLDGIAADWTHGRAADLNTLAIECVVGDTATPISRAPGLPDAAFENDGQLTKREVRAVTLSALGSLPGQLLWDVGSGSGSVAIEWLRLGGNRTAVAIERDQNRVATIARNGLQLGVPKLRIVDGEFPGVEVPGNAPDAVFVGGGVSVPGMLDAAWASLKGGGVLVVNAVTIESEQAITAFCEQHGGDMVRMVVERAETIGGHTGFKPMRAVTQLSVRKIS